ncbi:CHC2 zinc finger domain-containing protein, partial [Aeromonas jandaei]
MAGRIPQSFIDDLLARTDIVELIDSRVRLKKAGKNYQACCPFHNEKSPSFTVSQEKQFYHCFGCGAHGNAIGFVMEYDGLEFPDAIEELASQQGMQVPREQSSGGSGHSQPAVSKDLFELMNQI